MSLLEIIKERFIYEPETGFFRYRYDFNVMKKGCIAGRPNTNGHIQISVNNKRYMAHCLAWLYMTGEYPEDFLVDHIDRNYSNNAWINLRRATFTQNMGNRKILRNNKSGVTGVYWNKTKRCWIASISVNNKKKQLGHFASKEDATKAYQTAAKHHFGDFANV